MARTLNARAYPLVLRTIIESITMTGQPITYTFPNRRDATLVRNTWISYRKSLTTVGKPGYAAPSSREEAELLQGLSYAAERIQCNITPPLGPTNPGPHHPHTVTWTLRDALPLWSNLAAALPPAPAATFTPPPASPSAASSDPADMSWWLAGPSSADPPPSEEEENG